ncbi:quinolinate synthase NadA [Riemerella columbina]|uniref:quinolinate synthase NadA n=1 Tax=Riemerella columbina TaxID=103810 RepID=UPI00266F2639|nr:quinolinate synthase NadA [Riemerella columbina]WKS94901.1 quinolinate synthase NadA [Riemerella columbina]
MKDENNLKNANLPVPDLALFEDLKLPESEQLVDEISKLKTEKNIWVAVHTSQEVEASQAIADFVGTLKEVSEQLKTVAQETVLFTGTMADAGVLKMLHPEKTILFIEENTFFSELEETAEEDSQYQLLEEIYLALKYEFPYALLIDDSFNA